jgi:glycosyltransferase involved in cell wall biosynthesis
MTRSDADLASLSLPSLSIVVPAYNAQATLAETLDALANQTYQNWECVIVNDGSVDDTQSIAASFAQRDRRFRLVSQENRGSGGAYNTGVRAALHEFVCICSADDILLPEHLEGIAHAIIEHPDYDIFSTNGFFWMEDGSRKLLYSGTQAQHVYSWPLARVISVCFFSVGATYRKNWFDIVGGYREDVFGEDWDFWLRIMAQGARHLYTPQRTALHRVSDFQKSADLSRAYLSDIRILNDLVTAYELKPDDIEAVRASIVRREELIAQVENAKERGRDPAPSRLKVFIRSVMDAVIGTDRSERILQARSRK